MTVVVVVVDSVSAGLVALAFVPALGLKVEVEKALVPRPHLVLVRKQETLSWLRALLELLVEEAAA